MHKLPEYSSKQVRQRRAVEKRIVKAVVNDALTAGYALAVDDGEELHPATRDRKAIYDALMETDEDYLIFIKFEEGMSSKKCGWVRFVYGNDGWDVICDYTTNLESVLTRANAIAEKLDTDLNS